jgi:hypothetical protein
MGYGFRARHLDHPVGRMHRWGRLVVASSLLASGMLLLPVMSQVAQAATFTGTPPTRLYMAPEGTTLIAGLLGVPIGTLTMDGGGDVVSGDTRTIAVEAQDGVTGCDLSGTPNETSGVRYDINDCSRIQLVGSQHGRYSMGTITTITDGDGDGEQPSPDPAADDVYLLPSGARIDQLYQVPEGSFTLGLNGTQQQLNDALADLVFTPNDGYHYTGTSTGEAMDITVIPGSFGDPGVEDPPGSRSSANIDVEIRVLDVNDFPTHTGPASRAAEAQIELEILNAYTVDDEDNDEVLDNDPPSPPCPDGTTGGDEGPCSDPVDGDDQDMMLIGWLQCGQPIAPGTGFHFSGAVFQSDDLTIDDLFDFVFPLAESPDYQLAVDAFLEGLDLIDPGLKDLVWATSDETTYTDAFAGVASIDEIEDALSTVFFTHNAPDDTCELITVVTDLGNNGLPLSYEGDPPTGVEIPFLGFDFNVLEITTGSLQEITVDFASASPIVVNEADAPVEAVAELVISPASHPEFTIEWSARPGQINDPLPPDGSGIAAGGSDHNNVEGLSITIPADATTVPVPMQVFPEAPLTTVFADSAVEGNETYEYELDITTNPAPLGYFISSTVPTRTVMIIDDDDADSSVTTFGNVSGDEGDPGDSNTLTFTIGLDQPADGGETVDVALTPGSATNPGDYGAPSTATVTFAALATSATFTVPIVGDLLNEGDHSFTATLSNASGLSLTDTTATGTILDDDVASVVSIADVSVTEELGDADQLTVSMTNPVRNCQVAVTTSDGSATAGALLDYDEIAGAFFDMNMVASDVLNLTINDDLEVEGDETFDVSIALTGNADPGCEIGDGEATVTITDDDSASVVSIADATVTEGVAPSQTSVSMTNFLGRTCAVSLSSADGTAEEPGDYDALTGLLSVTSMASDVLGLTIVDDDFVEVDETFTVTITLDASSDPQCELGDAEATITIVSDDVASVVSIADATVTEGVAPSQATISMTNSVGRVCVLTLSSADGTAVEPDDYDAVTGQFSMTDVASDTLGLTIVDDPDPESTETFTVSMTLDASSDDQCELGDASATISILDDDAPPDLTKPSVTVEQAVGQSDPTAVAPILFTVEFSEPVTGFVDTDVTLGGTALPTSAMVSGSGTTYTITVDGMSANGTVTASVGAGVAQDAATNTNEASTSADNTVTYTGVPDLTKPSVTVEQAAGQSDPTSASPILFTVVFSEPVTGFENTDVVLGGSAAPTMAEVSGSGATYSVSVSGMAGPGTVTASVAAGAAIDAASNTSLASTSVDNTVTYAPGASTPVTIDVPDDITTDADPGQAGAVVVYGAVTTSGGVPPVTVDCTHDSGDFYPIGTTVVTCTATDSSPSGDIADGFDRSDSPEAHADTTVSASFSITVVDDESPTITVTPPNVTSSATNSNGAVVTYETPAASDNSGASSVTCTPPSGSFFNVGTTTVICTATDADGNTSTASFAVTVSGPTGGLPATGSSSGSTMLAALLLTVVGVLLRSASRRRTPAWWSGR